MLSHEVVDCNGHLFGGCQCNHAGSVGFDSSVVTVEPKSECIDSSFTDSCSCNEGNEDENSFIVSVNELIMAYSKQLNSETRILSGGLQQLMNRKSSDADKANHQPRRGMGSDTTTFHDLPDSLQLHILSFIGAKELCRVSQVCTHWFMLSADDLLWQQLLQRDVYTWRRIGHSTLPSLYQECQSDWSNKQIYLKCSPDIGKLMRQENLNFHNLSSILRSFLPRKTPKFAMFGPGLESSTSRITRKILEDTTGTFTVKGMFPGISEGVGSGFTIKLRNNTTFHLCILYPTTRAERENPIAAADRVHANRMLVHEANPEDEMRLTNFEVRPAIRQLCRTLDGFIFVVDATSDSETVQASVPEMKAMLNEMWAAPNSTLLVLAAVRDSAVKPTRSAVEIAEDLGLGKLSRPWQVECCIVDNLDGMTDALQWSVQTSHRQ